MRALAALALAALAACAAPPPPPDPEPVPRARPAAPAAAPGPSAASRAAAAYYRDIRDRRLAQGLLRVDGGAGVPFDAGDLIANFERIALFSEYDLVAGRYVASQVQARLRRWDQPVRVQMHFGASVSAEDRQQDRARVRALLGRIRAATGHPVALVERGGNYHVFVVSLDEQAALAPALLDVRPTLSRDLAREITTRPRSTFCANYAFPSRANPSVYDGSIALIRSEHPDLMRLACYHEELAQGMGLPNDSPAARPSIFNEDDQFATLTRHDEMLLRILYDDALRPGMTPEQARPVVARIANGLRAGPS
ncbi:DUF2927 domain-containing protein [Jannaschia sp. Os4]|uniref:DUF2927 domain-containing protein n=1 Tax=Jannaschia sp. Os4 TaxID=2807617 RepID=UPI00193AD392|nr:DUF2927 domain-containing protein [Jannaschia sp. Os4]MBM2577795.1 DUF2927 domain-containing protein [Jannaschia sp. Os4]